MKNYLTQKIEKPESPQQMLGRALKQLRDNKPVVNPKSVFNNHLRGIIEYILLQPLEIRKSLEKEIIDNINELHHQNNF